MGPYYVMMASPAVDEDLGLAQRVEDLTVEQLIAQASIEALDVAVPTRATPLDDERIILHLILGDAHKSPTKVLSPSGYRNFLEKRDQRCNGRTPFKSIQTKFTITARARAVNGQPRCHGGGAGRLLVDLPLEPIAIRDKAELLRIGIIEQLHATSDPLSSLLLRPLRQLQIDVRIPI